MHTRLTLQPHQRGAKQLLAKYGDRLVCVRSLGRLSLCRETLLSKEETV